MKKLNTPRTIEKREETGVYFAVEHRGEPRSVFVEHGEFEEANGCVTSLSEYASRECWKIRNEWEEKDRLIEEKIAKKAERKADKIAWAKIERQNARLNELPKKLQKVCRSYISVECPHCFGGFRDEEEGGGKCPHCKGYAYLQILRADSKKITKAKRMLKNGKKVSEILAEMPEEKERKFKNLRSAWLFFGKIDQAEYDRITDKVEYRHECTEYDNLLKDGYTKAEARKEAYEEC